jgi:hypothetical protein
MPLTWNLSHLNSKGSDLASNIFRMYITPSTLINSKTKAVHRPDWSTKKAHAHMIEGIMWYGMWFSSHVLHHRSYSDGALCVR